jgi:hypothetical protein
VDDLQTFLRDELHATIVDPAGEYYDDYYAVFFLDPEQGFRHRENTSVSDLREWARDLGAGEITEIDLSGVQFRCAGSTEYVDWLEGFLEGATAERNRILAGAWYVGSLGRSMKSDARNDTVVPFRTAADRTESYEVQGNVVAVRSRARHQPFDFRIYPDPFALERALREQIGNGASARLLSSYSRPWATRDAAVPGLRILIEVNLAGEAEKAGIEPDDLDAFVERSPVAVAGLMTMPPLSDDPEASRPWFSSLRALADERGLEHLSMGTSQDYLVAAEEGATIVRIGTRLYRG